jgi:signal transduction histidine kinase
VARALDTQRDPTPRGLDRCIAPSLRAQGGQILRRARVTAAAALLLLGSQVVGLVHSALEGWPGPALAMALGSGISVATLGLLRWRGELRTVGNLLALLLTLSTAAVCAADRGVATPLLAALAAAPLTATFVSGRRWGVLWLVVALSIVWGLHLGAPELPFSFGLMAPDDRPFNAVVVLTVLVCVVGLLGVAFESAQARALDDLRALSLSEQHARRRADAANRVKGSLLANVGHELRTPLSAIIGYSEMLADDAALDGRAEEEEDLRQILTAGTHLLGLVDDLLELSRLEAGNVEVQAADFDLAELLGEIEEPMRRAITAAGSTLEIVAPSAPVLLHTDQPKVRRILLKLLGNANKFTQGGTIRLVVRTAPRSTVEFEVRDSGIGMTDTQLSQVFDSFVQADSSMTRRHDGTGVGLRIACALALLLGGDLDARSEPGAGSTFTLRLPTTLPE